MFGLDYAYFIDSMKLPNLGNLYILNSHLDSLNLWNLVRFVNLDSRHSLDSTNLMCFIY
ncbi:hypothetical protein [Helicobacter sp. 16-1353]|uniref:hypothetical protein n=1 Tax=Helicobacter sp. 16-1353 TaxID=2004996 RepID=UPI0015EE46DA|nr:hypothetical protein [Helicobacter sp. 16-1353]